DYYFWRSQLWLVLSSPHLQCVSITIAPVDRSNASFCTQRRRSPARVILCFASRSSLTVRMPGLANAILPAHSRLSWRSLSLQPIGSDSRVST
ncbi:hypothetical protein CPC16_006057, partial [Podila verticillata]